MMIRVQSVLQQSQTSRRVLTVDGLGWLGLLCLIGLYAWLALTHLDGLEWDFDEGINVQLAWLVHDGYALYTPVWSDQPPGYMVLVAWAYRLFGVNLATARAVTVMHALVGLFAVAWATRETLLSLNASRAGAWLGALAAALVLGLAPNFWWASRAAMIALPTFALAALAMALSLAYVRRAQSRWLVGAALALGCCLWIKLQMLYLGPLLILLVVWTRWRQPRLAVRDLGILAAGSLGPLLLSLLVYDGRAMLQQVWLTYFATRRSFSVDWADNLRAAQTWLTADNWGLTLLAGVGVAVLVTRHSRVGSVLLSWWLLSLLTPLQHAPLFLEDHFQPLLFTLATLAGVAVGWGGMCLQSVAANGERQSQALGWASVTALGVLAYVTSLPHLLLVNQSLLTANDYGNDGQYLGRGEDDWAQFESRQADMRAADFMRDHSQPHQFVVTDNQLLAFHGQRRVPPEIAALNLRRVGIGEVTAEYLIQATQQVNAPVVVTYTNILTKFEPFMSWLGAHYSREARFGNSRRQGYLLNQGQ